MRDEGFLGPQGGAGPGGGMSHSPPTAHLTWRNRYSRYRCVNPLGYSPGEKLQTESRRGSFEDGIGER